MYKIESGIKGKGSVLFLMSCLLVLQVLGLAASTAAQPSMTIWFTEPAKEREDSLALGNGRIGAVLHHGVESELIQLSEETMWSNGPVSLEEGTRMRPYHDKVWKLLDEDKFKEADDLVMEHWFDDRPQLKQELLANMTLDFPGHENVKDYRRELDMRHGVTKMSYVSSGVEYVREAFVTAVDDVLVIRISANKPKAISFDLSLERDSVPHPPEIEVIDGVLHMYGTNDTPSSGLEFELQVRVLAGGGKVVDGDKMLSVKNADSVLIFVNAETNFEWGKILDLNLREVCAEKIDKAIGRGYATLVADHREDFSSYFDRCDISFGESTPEQRALPTDKRVNRMRSLEEPLVFPKNAKKNKGSLIKPSSLPNFPETEIKRDPELEAQLFQFARYLLIASSREGTQPAALHGIWPLIMGTENKGNNAYHMNINIAENYWPAEVTGLGDLHMPLVDFLEAYRENASLYAREGYGAGGAVVGHNIDAWMVPSRRGMTKAAAQWVGAYGWKAQHVWERFAFSQDKDYLRDLGFPIIKAAGEFLLDYSRPDPQTGEIYIGPSASPENSFIVRDENGKEWAVTTDYGVSMDQEIAYETWYHSIESARILGIKNDPVIERMKKALPKLALSKTDKDGKLLEWRAEREEMDIRHRHIAHVHGFHPGNRVTTDKDPEFIEAMKKTIHVRMVGDQKGDYSPGRLDWQHTWYMNIFARLRDRDVFERLYFDYYRIFLEHSLNSVWLNRPYQYDGSGAYTSGVAEALLQSHAGELHLFPCLLDVWEEGSFQGFKARGGLTVNASWSKGKVKAEVIASADGNHDIRYGDDVKTVALKKGKPYQVEYTRY